MAAHRDAALLLMGFAGAHRRSELVALRVEDVTVHPADGLHIRLRSSKTDQEGAGTVRAVPFGRDPVTCPPCALIRWRRPAPGLRPRQADRRADGRGAPPRSGGEHCCRTVDDAKQPPWADEVDGGDADPAVGERWLFPTVHRTGQPGRGCDVR